MPPTIELLYAAHPVAGMRRVADRLVRDWSGQAAAVRTDSLWLVPHAIAIDAARHSLVAAMRQASAAAAVLGLRIMTPSQWAESVMVADATAPSILPQPIFRQFIADAIASVRAAGQIDQLELAASRELLVGPIESLWEELARNDETIEDFIRRAAVPSQREQGYVMQRVRDRLVRLRLTTHAERFQVARQSMRSSVAYRQPQLLVCDWLHHEPAATWSFLEAAVRSARRAMVILPADADADLTPRPELVAGVPQLCDRLASCGRLVETASQAAGPEVAPLREVERRLFRPLAVIKSLPKPEAPGLALHVSSSQMQQARDVAQRVKQLIVERGAVASDIVVATPQPTAHEARLATAFREAGVPLHVSRYVAASRSSAMSALLAIVDLHVSDWRYRDLMVVVAHRSLTAFDEATKLPGFASRRAVVESWVERLQVANGRTRLLKALERHADGSGVDEGNPAAGVESAQEALGLLRRLDEALAALPVAAGGCEWAEHFSGLAKKFGLAIDSLASENGTTAAWNAICAAFAWHDRTPEAAPIGQADAMALLRDAADGCSAAMGGNPAGCVRLIDVDQAPWLSPRHLLLMGLEQAAWPRTRRKRLPAWAQAIDGRLRPNDQQLAIEADMSGLIVTLRSVGVTCNLYFAGLDDRGQVVPASSFVYELNETLDGKFSSLLGQTVTPAREVDQRAPWSGRQWRAQAVELAQSGKPSSLGAWIASQPAGAPSLLVSKLAMQLARSQSVEFTEYEGLLGGVAAREMATRFGPQHLWSASQLETYAACPFQFWMRNVLRLEPRATMAVVSDYIHRGMMLHRVLFETYRGLRDALADHPEMWNAPDDRLLSAQFRDALERVLAITSAAGGEQAAMAKIEAGQIERWALKLAEQEETYRKLHRGPSTPLVPTHFEVRFGPGSARSRHEPEDGISSDEPLVLKLPSFEIQVTGRIDRIDSARYGGSLVFTVIDYKSSERKTSYESVKRGIDLQPAIYAWGAEQLLGRSEPAWPLTAGYWDVRGKGFSEKSSIAIAAPNGDVMEATPDWIASEPLIRQTIELLVVGIRAGRFPVYSDDEHCTSRCDFAHTCRIGQVRQLEKNWDHGVPNSATAVGKEPR